MARRKLTKEEFDEQFDAFLQEPISGSEDSFDSAKIEKYLRAPSKQKAKAKKHWWEDGDDDLKQGTGLSSTGRSFLKSKNLGDTGGKDDPGESTLGDTGNGDTLTAKDRPRSRGKGGPPSPRRLRKTESSLSKDSLDLDDISEKSEEHEEPKNQPETSFDLTPNTTVDTGGLNQTGKPGADTLDEMEDKQKFFKDLEAEESVDYGRLNRELSGTTLSPGAAGTLAAIAEHTHREAEEEEEVDEVPEEVIHSSTTDRNASDQKPSMLSKVSLLDSMDSTLNTTTSPQVDRSGPVTGREENFAETGRETSIMTRTQTGVMGTNTSQDLEDLHKALKEVNMSPTIHPDQPTIDDFFARGRAPKPAVGIEPDLPRSGNNRGGNGRDIGDIFKEMDALQQKVRASQHLEEDVKLREDYMSPRTPPSGIRHRETDEDTHPDLGGFDNSHTEDTEVFQPVTSVGPARGRLRTVRDKQERKQTRSAERAPKPLPEPYTQPAASGTAGSSLRHSGKFDHVKSSGYGQRSPSRGRTRTPDRSPHRKPPSKSKAKLSATTDGSGSRLKGTQVLRNSSLSPTRRRDGGELVTSTEAFVSSRRGGPEARWSHESPKVTGSSRWSSQERERERSLIREVQEWQEQWKAERRHKMDLQNQMETLQSIQEERAAAERKELEEQVFQLKQDNFVLKAKLEEAQSRTELRKHVAEGGSLVGMSQEQVSSLEKEIAEQERLITGYQTENKRLYEDISTIKKRTKQTEERMFKENQKMAAEVASLKSKLEQAESARQNQGVITSLAAQQQIAAGNRDSKMAILEEDLREAKRRIENLSRELSVVGGERGSLERHVEQLVKEREHLQRQLEDAKHITPEEARKLEAAHQEEVDKLQRKLKWYAENQELLDKMADQLRQKEEEIRKLKSQIENLSSETGRKVEESKVRARERAADARRIQDLERQVKEMEGIIKRRHPNSLSALMMTVAAIPDERPSVRGPSVGVLEERLRKLEAELAAKDEEANARVRSVEQKFNSVKFQYEERVADLERQVALGRGDSERPHTHSTAMERELDSVRERHRKQVSDLQAQVNNLTFELNKLRKSSEGASKNGKSRDAENELRQQVAVLQRELEEKAHQVLVLNKSLERLRKQTLLNKTFSATMNGDLKKTRTKGKGPKGRGDDEEGPGDGQLELSAFEEMQVKAGKEYQPRDFAEPHIVDVVRENEELKARLEQVMLEREQERVSLRKSLAESESFSRRSREDFEEKIESLRQSHQQEIRRLLSDQALQYSASTFAELQTKADTQEVMIKHLREQLAKAQVEAEQVAVLKIRETGLRTQIETLQDQLRVARENLTPEMRQFESLQEKILQLERRLGQREAELQQTVRQSKTMASAEVAEEVGRWRALVESKNAEIQRFRVELDSMLDVIKVLQKQGVVIPFSSGLGLRTT